MVVRAEKDALMLVLGAQRHVQAVEVNVSVRATENALKHVQQAVAAHAKLVVMTHVSMYVKTNVEICVSQVARIHA